MNSLLDAASLNNAIGIIAAAAFFLIFAAVAYIVFRLLRKTVKTAFRLMIVAVILLIAVAGSVSFWWLGTSKPTRIERPKTSQSK